MTNDHPTEERIGAFLDAELPDLESQAIAAHLQGCAVCAGLADEIAAIGADLAWTKTAAPPALSDRVRAALAGEPRGSIWLDGWADWWRAARRSLGPSLSAMAAVALVSAGIVWLSLGRVGEPSYVAHDLLTAHLRALAQEGAIQVASSDQHTVKPWFAGKVDFSPEARDLAGEGFTLVGGRLDVVDGRRVGALVYRRRLHLIDVFAWPAGPDAPAAATLRMERGYSLLSWSKKGVVYWAVSDLDPVELRRFATLL